MGFLDRFERSIDSAVNGAFARVFKGDVQPVEIATRLLKELDSEARLVSRDRRLVPNQFTVILSTHDYERLAPYAKALNDELVPEMRQHAGERGYVFNGPIVIDYTEDADLPTGRFSLESHATAEERPGTPAPTASGVVLEVNGMRHPLEAPGLTVGRGSEASIRINDPGISRRHAEFRVTGTGADMTIEIVDLGSTNGITVNGSKITDARVIGPGARIEMGTTRMLVHIPQGG